MIRPEHDTHAPRALIKCKTLIPGAKLLYTEFVYFNKNQSFFLVNIKYFAALYQVTPNTIKRWLISLEENGFIKFLDKKNKLIEVLSVEGGSNE